MHLMTPLLNIFNISEAYVVSILKGIIEVTNGLKALTSINVEVTITKICIAAFLLGFGGISVLMQVSSIISKNNLSIKPYLLGKFLHGFIASLYTFLALKYTNLASIATLTVFNYSNNSKPLIINETSNLISVICGISLFAIVTRIVIAVAARSKK